MRLAVNKPIYYAYVRRVREQLISPCTKIKSNNIILYSVGVREVMVQCVLADRFVDFSYQLLQRQWSAISRAYIKILYLVRLLWRLWTCSVSNVFVTRVIDVHRSIDRFTNLK